MCVGCLQGSEFVAANVALVAGGAASAWKRFRHRRDPGARRAVRQAEVDDFLLSLDLAPTSAAGSAPAGAEVEGPVCPPSAVGAARPVSPG